MTCSWVWMRVVFWIAAFERLLCILLVTMLLCHYRMWIGHRGEPMVLWHSRVSPQKSQDRKQSRREAYDLESRFTGMLCKDIT